MRLLELRAHLDRIAHDVRIADSLEVRIEVDGSREFDIFDIVLRASKPHALYLEGAETLEPAREEEPF